MAWRRNINASTYINYLEKSLLSTTHQETCEVDLWHRIGLVPHFSSRIVEQAKRDTRENHPMREKRDAAVKEQAILTLGDFHMSLRNNEGLLIVYLQQV